MIYLNLFLGFLKVGCFSFGGAYAAIPLIRDVVLSYGWLTDEMLTYMIAVSESTPGPIMVNLATYVGASQAGLLGSVLATFAVVLPAFLIILAITAALGRVLKNRYVQAALDGIKPAMIGIILATGLTMTAKNFFNAATPGFDRKAFLLTAGLAAVYFGSRRVLKKPVSPILLIVISAVTGIVAYGI